MALLFTTLVLRITPPVDSVPIAVPVTVNVPKWLSFPSYAGKETSLSLVLAPVMVTIFD